MTAIQELIALNSANEDYLIGDALLELLPLDFIKPSELGGSSVRICCEDNIQVETDFINVFKQVEGLITEGIVLFSNTQDKEMVGSFGLMRLRTSPHHSDRVISIPTHLDVWNVLTSHYITL